jgi:hypothetical protein
MTRAEEYRQLAEHVRARARSEESRSVATGWNNLAECYALLARQAERYEEDDQKTPRGRERPQN